MSKENSKMAKEEKPKKGESSLKGFLSGGFGGACLVMVGHPLDLIKVKLQTMTIVPGKDPPYKGLIDCAQKTLRREGPLGFYRGVTAPLTGIAPVFAVCFWGYDVGQQVVRSVTGKSPSDSLNLAEIMFAGGFSAIPTTALMAPMERVKCLLQIQASAENQKPKYAGMMDCGKQLLREGGLRSLFRGWELTLIRDIPGSIAYFGVYEVLKRVFSGGDPSQLSPAAVLCAGGFAGVANWMVAIPPDTVKSRLQTAPEGKYPGGFMDVYRELMKNEGIGALYRGVAPVMVRAFPANAACFFGVEVSRSFLTSIGMD
mmetsp:Transcript_33283/g.43891  ORF Transcript_33283/g.43891 Transcript_33283/m.43891 type:complete len:314 (+) Transcript_33283:69-1010(+)|eukprot:CAMPEP_0117746888 /NCGR_PEP_ID=MMETSP0947-20121206/8199_1 /TAXON_ID=44440 /ORGANISM="Chattonella subsalsa, Strain CCMP2191" /LENGTH=313 /DNA_ID=CAMNT_0005564267 /DNA_START=38 /DNA_END=979 /DNA_ORIENTATION=-